MIWWLPLEPLEQRYTAQMDGWVQDAMRSLGQDFVTVYGDAAYAKIENGEWLDTLGSAKWKYSQLSKMVDHIASGKVASGDIVLCGDVWMAGIEGIRQVSELQRLRLSFAGWHYAGCFDHYDLLSRTLTQWGTKYELCLIEGVFDAVAFGSQYHRDFVSRHASMPAISIPCGLAWRHEEVASYRQTNRRREIAFTHRWSDEKRWYEFCALALMFKGNTDWSFVYSTSGMLPRDAAVLRQCADSGIQIIVHADKKAYYEWLGGVAIMWSGADQETFGYSFMEAIACGCRIVAPHRAAYPNHFARCGLKSTDYLYPVHDCKGEAALRAAMDGHLVGTNAGIVPNIVSSQYTNSVKEFLEVLRSR